MRIDLHTHTRVSDGTQSPTELVLAAADTGLDVLGLTDHDSADSWPEAWAAAEELGLTLVRGIEVSSRFRGKGVHLLAYLPDPTYPPLAEHLRLVLDGRVSRVPAVVEKLRGLGIDITEDDVRRAANGTAATGRPHIADAMVTLGVVDDRTAAFRAYLNPGMPAYVDRYAAPLPEMIDVVAAAGGVTVVAHPWGRRGPAGLAPDALAELAERGLAGIEVDHQDHRPEDRERLRVIARDLDLVVTGSSDHHGTGKVDHELGCNLTDAEQYERLLCLAAAASDRSGRDTPTV